MRVHTVSIINQKGGVGKTTSVANIGAAMAAAGHKVLLVISPHCMIYQKMEKS